MTVSGHSQGMSFPCPNIAGMRGLFYHKRSFALRHEVSVRISERCQAFRNIAPRQFQHRLLGPDVAGAEMDSDCIRSNSIKGQWLQIADTRIDD
jgi:hypothetical protein